MRYFKKLFCVVLFLHAIIFCFSSFAQEKEKISITSDKLILDHNEKFAEFIGDVKVDYKDTLIFADIVSLAYGQKESLDNIFDRDSIKEIVATGNVTIKTEKLEAVSEKAVYKPETEFFILSGENSRVIDGDNSIVGAKIIVDMKRENITVERGKKSRVEAIFVPSNGN